MAETKQPQNFRLEDSKAAELTRLPRFKGVSFSEAIRTLVLDAIEEERSKVEAGFLGIIKNYKDHDFSHHISNSKLLLLKVPNFSLFSPLREHGERLLHRIWMEGYKTFILFEQVFDESSGTHQFHDRDNYAINAFIKKARDITELRKTAAEYNNQSLFPSFWVAVRSAKDCAQLPTFSLVADNEVFASYRKNPYFDKHVLHWARDVNGFNEWVVIRADFIKCCFNHLHESDLMWGPSPFMDDSKPD